MSYPQYPQNPQYGQQQYPQPPQYGQQYGQQQYGQPQYPQGWMPPRPDSYLVWSILVTIFCCLPLGIVAIVKSSHVDSRYNSGDYQGALKASNDAKNWVIISAVSGVVIQVINVILRLLMGIPLFFIDF
ncbi:MAG: CD225/dispanin family protein [Muribaculaceae bacterium]